jgi:hypothetical protein
LHRRIIGGFLVSHQTEPASGVCGQSGKQAMVHSFSASPTLKLCRLNSSRRRQDPHSAPKLSQLYMVFRMLCCCGGEYPGCFRDPLDSPKWFSVAWCILCLRSLTRSSRQRLLLRSRPLGAHLALWWFSRCGSYTRREIFICRHGCLRGSELAFPEQNRRGRSDYRFL